MKIHHLLAVSIFALTSATVFADHHIQYTTAGLNVRTGPSIDYKKIGTLEKCEKVGVGDCVDEYGALWCEVIWNYQTGWVAAEYLSKKNVCDYPKTKEPKYKDEYKKEHKYKKEPEYRKESEYKEDPKYKY